MSSVQLAHVTGVKFWFPFMATFSIPRWVAHSQAQSSPGSFYEWMSLYNFCTDKTAWHAGVKMPAPFGSWSLIWPEVNLTYWNPNTNVTVLGGGALDKWLGHEGGALVSGISALLKNPRPFHHVRIQWEACDWKRVLALPWSWTFSIQNCEK